MNYRQCRNYENLEKQFFDGTGKYGIPEILPEEYDGCQFVAFSEAKDAAQRELKGVHFFIDDYRFLRTWNAPASYIKLLQQFRYVMSPDFSTYTDFPMAIQIYNHYRKHWLAAFWQQNGIKVILTISWGTEESYEWCFDGEPRNSVVAISSIGTQKGKESKELFLHGYEKMVEVLEPDTIIFYGKVPDECKGNIIRIKSFQEKFTEVKCNGW